MSMKMDQRPVCSGSKRIGYIQKPFYSWWWRKIALLISKIDDHQEADHCANMGERGRRTVIIDKGE